MIRPPSKFNSPLPEGVTLEENVYVTMRDGVKIPVDIYRPTSKGRYPAIFSTSAYIKGIQTYAPELSHSIEAGATFFMVKNGYVHVIGQARGSGLSQGQYNWYDWEEQKDGYEMVEWIAQQPWCDGNVGMMGDSYFGRMQWLIAALQPPHLKCIAPYDGSMDDYRSRHDGGLVRGGFLYGWGADTMFQALWPGPVEGKLPPTNLFAQLAENPDDGPFYRERSGITHVDQIKIPVLSIAVGSSRLHSRSQLMGWPLIKAPKKLVILPFLQRSSNVVLVRSRPLNEYLLSWFDTWLRGKQTGIMDEPAVVIMDRATQECRYENEYPLARTQWATFYLHSSAEAPADRSPYGLMNPDPPKEESPDSYTEPEAIERVHADQPVIAYATAPLKNDLRVWGPLSLTLYGSSTTTDTAWFVRIGDITPDGRKSLLSMGVLKASYREVDLSKSIKGQPYHTFRDPVLPEPGRIYEYQIPISPIFYTFRKGHKVWIQIASNDTDYMHMLSTVYTSEMVPVPCQNTLYHDAAHPSHLLLPVIPDAPAIKPVPPPLSDFKFPLGNTAMR
jgi:predicted acyl esterase